MRSRKVTIGVSALCLILAVWACSGVESRLTGRWRSTKPDSSVALTIAPSGSTHGEGGYRDGLTVTFNGTTYAQQYWRIRHVGQNTFLDISNGVVTGAELSGGAVDALPHKVIELTSDKLVLAWEGHGGNSGVYEFRRVQ